MKTGVLVPAFNEALSIGMLVEKIRRSGLDVLVIDDGSADDTFQRAKEKGAFVLKNHENQGKGATLIRGFEYMLKNNYDAVVTLDGDGQHLPEEILLFIEAANRSSASVFIGKRSLQKAHMPFIRVLTNRFMSWLISKIARQDIPDTQCGFRLIKKEALSRLTLSTSGYETESQILLQASREGFRIESLPISTVYTGSKSRINPFIDTLRFLKFILKEPWNTKS